MGEYTKNCRRCSLEKVMARGYAVRIPYGLHEKFCPKRYPKHPERAKLFRRLYDLVAKFYDRRIE